MEDRRIAGEILDEAVLEVRRIDDWLKQIKLLLRRRPEQFFSKEDANASYEALSKSGAELTEGQTGFASALKGTSLLTALKA